MLNSELGLPTNYSNNISNQGRAGLCAERQVRQPFVHVAFIGLLVLLTSKTLFNASIHGITLFIDAFDGTLMLRVVSTKSAFSIDW